MRHCFRIVAALCVPGGVASAQAPRVIRYPAVGGTAATRIESPTLTLSQSDCELNRANGIILQRNGGIVVSNAGDLQFCFFDARGKFVKKAGRRGSGPGEFGEMYWPALYRGDSIVVTDRMQHRVTIFGPAGEPGREFVVLEPDSLGSQTLTIALPSGDFLFGFSEITTAAPRPDAVMFYQQIIRSSPTGSIGSRVARFPDSEHFIQKTLPQMGGVAYWDRAFTRRLSVGVTSTGFVAGDGTDGVVREYDASGAVRTHHATSLEGRPVTPDVIQRYKDGQLKGERPERRAITEKMVSKMPYPAAMPAYSNILADPAGALWVSTYPDSTGSNWLRLTPASATAKAFRFPARFRPYAVRGERVCGIGRDADDLQTVYCFTIPPR